MERQFAACALDKCSAQYKNFKPSRRNSSHPALGEHDQQRSVVVLLTFLRCGRVFFAPATFLELSHFSTFFTGHILRLSLVVTVTLSVPGVTRRQGPTDAPSGSKCSFGSPPLPFTTMNAVYQRQRPYTSSASRW